MALYLRYAVRSDLGLVRTNNEDSVYAGPRLLAIADGMGGHAAGEVASKIVIAALEHLDDDRRVDDLMAALRESVAEANHRIADAVDERGELEGMGTTLTALRFVGSHVGLVHVGDSRAYLMRQGQLAQITHDDTYVQYLVDSGNLTPDEAKDHPRKSVILRALLGTEVEPDVAIRESRAGDRYLLCSDGLSDVVSVDTISDTMTIADPQDCADRLVELALRSGGPDNVTVIVADVLNAKVGDRIDDTPVIAGAFVDPAAADVPGSGSAAERAAQMARRPTMPVPVTPAYHPKARHRWRSLAVTGVVVAALLAALAGAYAWTQTQYFVGHAGDEVAIYQGVDTEFGPLKFFTVSKVTDLKISSLNSSVRSQVMGGITARSSRDADGIVKHLRDQQVRVRRCLPLSTSAAASASASSSGSGALSVVPGSGSDASSGSASASASGSTRASGATSRVRSAGRGSTPAAGATGATANGAVGAARATGATGATATARMRSTDAHARVGVATRPSSPAPSQDAAVRSKPARTASGHPAPSVSPSLRASLRASSGSSLSARSATRASSTGRRSATHTSATRGATGSSSAVASPSPSLSAAGPSAASSLSAAGGC